MASNFAVDRTAGSHSLAAAGHRERWADGMPGHDEASGWVLMLRDAVNRLLGMLRVSPPRAMRLRPLLLTIVTLILGASRPAAALCVPPAEVTSSAPVNYRYAWFFIESLAHARLGWQEADSAADSQHAVARLASLKLAVEDFQCAASLVQTFQGIRGPDEFTTKALQASADGATLAYTTFTNGFQRWVTALARAGGLPLDEAADLKVQNEKAGEFLIHAASAAWFALLKPRAQAALPMDRLSMTRAERAALREGLRRRFPAASTHDAAKAAHTPDLAAAVLDNGLSNSRYKAVDER